MPNWLQNLVVVIAFALALAFLIREGWRTLAGKRSRLGSCCAKGCGAQETPKPASGERIVFLPVEMLKRRK
ncbi:MAG: hypothetical protein M3O30_04575 [Planctomycetota bacterium]|nr:hypothetical protein [Planctomycetota bacterium]